MLQIQDLDPPNMQRNDARNAYTSTAIIEALSGWNKLQDWTMNILAMLAVGMWAITMQADKPMQTIVMPALEMKLCIWWIFCTFTIIPNLANFLFNQSLILNIVLLC